MGLIVNTSALLSGRSHLLAISLYCFHRYQAATRKGICVIFKEHSIFATIICETFESVNDRLYYVQQLSKDSKHVCNDIKRPTLISGHLAFHK